MRYATCTTWAEYFERHEGVKITHGGIRYRLRLAEKIGVTTRNQIGHVVKKGFYSEADVRAVCADLLDDTPRADDSGFFKKDGEMWGSMGAWAIKLSISPSSVGKVFKKANVFTIKGRGLNGKEVKFYSESTVRTVCASLLQEFPQADDSGFFKKDGEVWGTKRAWARKISVISQTLARRLQKIGAAPIEGKRRGGQKNLFYKESDVRTACLDHLEEIPQANDSGFFEKDGEVWGGLKAWSRILPITCPTIKKRLRISDTSFLNGKCASGHITRFYCKADVYSACADLIEEIPQANGEGFFELKGETWGSFGAWARKFSLSRSSVSLRLKKVNAHSIKARGSARGSDGQIICFYCESDFMDACSELLSPHPEADRSGFFERENELWGTIGAWKKRLGIADKVLKKRLQKADIPFVVGKNVIGRKLNFYRESDVRSVCADLFEKLAYADSSGFFEKGEETWGTIRAWSRKFSFSEAGIKKRLQKSDAQSAGGRGSGGQKHFFYSESDVLSSCRDILEDLPQANDSGFFEKDNDVWGYIKAWSRALSITEQAIKKRLRKFNISFLYGRLSNGNRTCFYPEPAVREACKDLLEKRRRSKSTRSQLEVHQKSNPKAA